MKKKIFAVFCLLTMLFSATSAAIIPASAADDWMVMDPVKDADYSFVVLGDIQNATYSDAKNGTAYVESMISWVLENKEERNIQYLFGLGDSVETLTTYAEAFRNPQEWDVVAPQFARLNGNLPYSVVRGNHDDEAGYHEHICTDAYRAQMEDFFYNPVREATHGNSMSNSYQRIKVGNHKYLMLSLDFRVTPESLAWASDVIYKHYDHKVIISLHSYLNSNGTLLGGTIGSSNADNTVLEWLPFSGEEIWDNLISLHPNVFMVLCGHMAVNDPVIRTRVGKEGNEVIEVLVDPQGYEQKDPCGVMMLLNFTGGGQRIEIEYFSPSKGLYYKEKNQVTLNLPAGTLPTYVAATPKPQEPIAPEASEPEVIEPEVIEPEVTEPTVESESEVQTPPKNQEKNTSAILIGGILFLIVLADLIFFILMKVRMRE